MATGCEELISSAPTLAMGLVDVAPMLLMREPVTSTRSVVWATAGIASTPMATSTPVQILVLWNMSFELLWCVRVSGQKHGPVRAFRRSRV
ncbi:MAG: hypothetical protein Q7U99_21865 [Rubrivivax sp.]|nr:hypothetical protein [Rubrivivax sp.]